MVGYLGQVTNIQNTVGFLTIVNYVIFSISLYQIIVHDTVIIVTSRLMSELFRLVF